jgi:hypothetical protein
VTHAELLLPPQTSRHAQAAAVMSLDTDQSLMGTVHLHRSPANTGHLLQRSLEQAERGELLAHPLIDADQLDWQGQDRRQLKRINQLIQACLSDASVGIGKPEPLRENLAGGWSLPARGLAWVSLISQSLLIRGSQRGANQSRTDGLRSSRLSKATTTLGPRPTIGTNLDLDQIAFPHAGLSLACRHTFSAPRLRPPTPDKWPQRALAWPH